MAGWFPLGAAPTSGFTTVLPVQPVQAPSGNGAGSRQIYVSSSTGNNGNAGTINAPFATAAFGATKVRNGFSDQLLLKCGDSFTNDPVYDTTSGRFTQSGIAPTILSGALGDGATISGPILIGSYGVGQRPLFNVPIDPNPQSRSGAWWDAQTGDGDNVFIQGIELYAYTRDPASGSYAGASAASASSLMTAIWNENNSVTFFGVEDCKITYFLNGILIKGPDSANAGTTPSLMTGSTLVLRRNIVAYSYAKSSLNAQGVFTDGVHHAYYVENFFDHCGWNEDAGLLAATCGATAKNRSLYDSNGGISVQATVTRDVRGNIFARSSGMGAQFRAGGVIKDNLFVKNNVNGFDIGENFDTSYSTNSTITGGSASRNVVLESQDIPSSPAQTTNRSGGQGIQISNAIGVVVDSNIVAQCASASDPTNAVAVVWDPTRVSGNDTLSGCVASNNIIFSIHAAYTDTTNAAVAVTGQGNFVDTAGNNAGSSPEPFPHPTPTNSSLVGDYYQSIGGTGSFTDFLATCAARAGGTWDRKYTAYAVNDYVQASYGVSYRS